MEENKLHDIEEQTQERVILVGVDVNQNPEEVRISLMELEELAKTAGAYTCEMIIQSRTSPHPATYVGKGKLEEIKDALYMHRANGVIMDDELSPAQLKNIEAELDVKVMDRSLLILDIFAKHAHTREGIIQVELAQLNYRVSRLAGLGKSLSRLGGGIGTRGPGEKKLETDRRHIRSRMAQLRSDLKDVKRHRDMLRESRKKQGKPVVAIAGYTNAGKSTLLNKLTDANVLEENMLFATLDPTTRALSLPQGKEVLLTDTVGFIHKLPHHLVEAFQSTLEEVVYSDLIIHVVDGSNDNFEKHMEVFYETLRELEALEIPIFTIFNKMDVYKERQPSMQDKNAEEIHYISAKNGEGLEGLVSSIEAFLQNGLEHIQVKIPYDQANVVQNVRTYGQLLDERYEEDGIYIEAYLETAFVDKFKLRSVKFTKDINMKQS